jgi:hypothetical protein
MKPALLALTLVRLVFGQQSTVIGTISKLADSEIQVKTPRGSFTIYAGDRTEVLKGKTYRGLAPLKTGDEISVRCEPDSAGKVFAVKIWASVVTFTATVKHLNQDDIEVVTSPSADSQREEHKIVNLHPDTVYSTNRKDVAVGQDIRVVGLDLGNGAVDAARIALYNTDLPVKQ